MLSLLPPRIQKTAREIQRRVQGERLTAVSRPSVMPEALSFLEPIDEIEEEAPPRLLRSIHYIMVGMFLLTILLAAVMKVDVVVSGTGRIATESPPLVMQSIDRSIIRDLPVQIGDEVKKGQVLATLDPTFAQADLGSLTAQKRAYEAEMRRLNAELSGEPLQLSSPPTAEELLQQSYYEQRKAQYESRLRIFDEELRLRSATLHTTEDHRDSEAKQLGVARELESMRSQLLEKQIGSKLNYLEAEGTRMRVEQDLTDTVNKLAESEHDLQSKQAERQAFIDEWRNQLLNNLITTRTELAKVGEDVSKASLVNDLVVITAPQDGVVLDVINRGVGSIVREGEPVVSLVESKSKLIGDITINSSDIGYTRMGDPVVVKVDAFPYQRHGFLKGRLAAISEESFSTTTGAQDGAVARPNKDGVSGALHHGRVELLDTKLDAMPPGAKLIPGMTLTAEIKVGKRSVLSYFLNPLTRAFGESIREP